MDITGAHFWQSYMNIDIWRKLDIESGVTTFFLYNDGTIHERNNEKEILDLAKFIFNARVQRIKE